MEIYYSPKFKRQYKKLPLSVKNQAEQVEKLFRLNPFNPKLKTHKLSGRFNIYLSFSIDYQNRIIFEFYRKGMVRFHSVGDHSIYK